MFSTVNNIFTSTEIIERRIRQIVSGLQSARLLEQQITMLSYLQRNWSGKRSEKVESKPASPATLSPTVNDILRRKLDSPRNSHSVHQLLLSFTLYLCFIGKHPRSKVLFFQDSDSLISIILTFVYVNLSFVLYIFLFQPLFINCILN